MVIVTAIMKGSRVDNFKNYIKLDDNLGTAVGVILVPDALRCVNSTTGTRF